MSPRPVTVLLGVWLFISAFVWPHSPFQMTNTWLCGLLCIVFAFLAFAIPAARYLTTALAVWLFVSAFALPSFGRGTIWNNTLVAIALFAFSLTPSPPRDLGLSRPRPPRPA
jgi:hypothetical protein